MSKRLALFDLDGTITRKDTLFDFLIYSYGRWRFVLNFAASLPDICRFFVHGITNSQLKERVLIRFFSGKSWRTLTALGNSYGRERLPSIIKPSALDRIEWHKDMEHDVYIVSASAETWLAEWCRLNDLKLICTRLQHEDGIATGTFWGKNCHGPEKIRRIKAEINLAEYVYIYAYGDSHGDREMLAMADESYYKYFS